MCEPATILTIATVASGAAGFVGANNAARAQDKANEQARNLAIQNQQLQIRSLRNAEDEEARRASESLVSNARAADSATATAQVSAGEAGVSGLSVDALLGDIIRQETENRQDVLQTQDFGQRQRQLDREGLGITTQSQFNQLPLVQYPSFFEHAANTAVSAFGVHQRASDRTTTQTEQ